jgi:hypothetical protein
MIGHGKQGWMTARLRRVGARIVRNLGQTRPLRSFPAAAHEIFRINIRIDV